MPDYYAHLQFGEQVFSALPAALRARLEGEQDAYILGQYGPDPLFFYRLIRGSTVRASGVEMHHRPAREVLERLRRAVEENRPWAAGYAAGFLCHFALDSHCHPYIGRLSSGGGHLTHTCVESEFDRFLMLRSGLDPHRDTPLPSPEMPETFYTLLERTVYLDITAEQFKESMASYRKLCLSHTRALDSGPTRGLMNLAARVSPKGAYLRNLVLKLDPPAGLPSCNEAMLELLYQAIPEAVGQLGVFFSGEPLGAWFDRDFNGETRG